MAAFLDDAGKVILVIALHPLCALAALAIGYFLPLVQSRGLRIAGFVMLPLVPVALVYLSGLMGNCRPFGTQECMLGFGVVLAVMYSTPLWLGAELAGAGIRWWMARNRA